MNKKIFLSPLLPFFVCGICYATMPFPDKVTKTSDQKITIRLKPWEFNDNNAIMVENDQGKILKKFPLKTFMAKDDFGHYNYTSAGCDWYNNSITFTNKTDEYFIVRLRWDKIIVINLKTQELQIDISNALNNEIEQTIHQKALDLLTHEKPNERQTAAIVCGQLKIKESIPKLKELLQDNNYYTSYPPKGGKTVYYVRKAAKEALESMGKVVENIIVEEAIKKNI